MNRFLWFDFVIFKDAIIIKAVIHKLRIIRVKDILSMQNRLDVQFINMDEAVIGLKIIISRIRENGFLDLYGRRGIKDNSKILIIRCCQG